MTTLRTTRFPHVANSLGGPLQRLVDEAAALLQALAQPGPLLRDVEHFGALLAQARAVEAAQPARAAQLRRRASQLVLH